MVRTVIRVVPAHCRWMQLLGAYIGCGLACGPLSGWPLWVPLLIRNGYAANICTSHNVTVILRDAADVAYLHEAITANQDHTKIVVVRNLTFGSIRLDTQVKHLISISNSSITSLHDVDRVFHHMKLNRKNFTQTQSATLVFRESGCNAQTAYLGNLYTVGFALSQIFMVVLGLLFDQYGPRWTAVTGAFTSALGFALLSISVQLDTAGVAHLPVLAYLGMAVSDVGSFLNLFSLTGFIYSFPSRQGFVMGLAGSSYCVAGLLAFIPQVLVDSYGWPVHYSLYFMCCLAVVGMCLGFLCLTKEEFTLQAEQTLGFSTRADNSLKSSFKDLWDVIMQFFFRHFVFAATIVLMSSFFLYYWSIFYPFITYMVESDSAAKEIMGWYNVFAAVCGITLGPVAGRFLDSIGFRTFVAIRTLIQLSFMVLTFDRSFIGQMISIFLASIWFSLSGLMPTRWATYYAPPNLIGTLVGVLITASGVCQLVVVSLLTYVSASHFSGADAMVVPLKVLAFSSIGLSVSFALAVCLWELPAVPPLPRSSPSGYKLHPLL